MNKITTSINKQFKNNILAILSLTIAITALGYNSWRNELSEQNRNIRHAGFEIIKETARLQQFLDHATFNKEQEKSKTPIEGWVRINLIQSLSMFMNDAVRKQADSLFTVWRANWQDLQADEQANAQLSLIINCLIEEVRLELRQLN